VTAFPGSPRVLKAGLVLVDPDTHALQRVIVLQYNPDQITRTLQVKKAGEGADRSQLLRLIAPPVEEIKLDAEVDATDQLEAGDSTVQDIGLQGVLAALETTIYPTVAQLRANDQLAARGTLEIAPMETGLMLLVLNRRRIVPVTVTSLSITEEAFDPSLNPIRAKISLGLRVLSVYDLGFPRGSLYLVYQQEKERLAAGFGVGTLAALGQTRIV
jgi:hypothetical protein